MKVKALEFELMKVLKLKRQWQSSMQMRHSKGKE